VDDGVEVLSVDRAEQPVAVQEVGADAVARSSAEAGDLVAGVGEDLGDVPAEDTAATGEEDAPTALVALVRRHDDATDHVGADVTSTR
jgi:hypothetical protein